MPSLLSARARFSWAARRSTSDRRRTLSRRRCRSKFRVFRRGRGWRRTFSSRRQSRPSIDPLTPGWTRFLRPRPDGSRRRVKCHGQTLDAIGMPHAFAVGEHRQPRALVIAIAGFVSIHGVGALRPCDHHARRKRRLMAASSVKHDITNERHVAPFFKFKDKGWKPVPRAASFPSWLFKLCPALICAAAAWCG